MTAQTRPGAIVTEESEIRTAILRQAAELEGALGWQDPLHNDIATDLLNEECVRGEITDGGTAIVTGIRERGRKELESSTARGKARLLSKRIALLIWAALVAAFVYVMQLDSARRRLSDLIDNILE